ncbi:DnaJ type IV chaperone protein [Synechococcus sp. BIOS-E4-1]|uniref:ribbon-helix-helix protein, CopG family n=1 Tax=Synechococcus sp. BIOS-E4-1 TaxID=1400864 RepID=UPI0016446B6E|nr:ribbon-helix-helix protein, CopG family [Synechococcus sp. BIOS-E4-1]QNI54726.1 DnaJ type IV chaperone protein [Synechococcus sp. BIOS-E4-1]
MSGKRISLELPEELVDQIDQLRKDWKTRSRGECLRRLLEEIFHPDLDQDDAPGAELDPLADQSPEDSADPTASEAEERSKASLVTEPIQQPQYDEDRAIVLVGSAGGLDTTNNEQDRPVSPQPPTRNAATVGGGIDLPGFVRKRSNAIRESLTPSRQPSTEIPLVPVISDEQIKDWSEVALNHWLTLYGSNPGPTVMEAVMLWMARDIWPHIDGSEGRTFTWSQVNHSMTEFCKSWMVPSPRFEQVIVAAAVLEDPFASASVPDRIPTLIRRFVSRFKRSRKVTSFQTLESTMTLHGALKQLELPTQAGQSLTLRSIRDAYKRKAVEVHPDSGGSTDAMRRLNEAYQMLKELYRQKEMSQ